jgi:hypothetical protein
VRRCFFGEPMLAIAQHKALIDGSLVAVANEQVQDRESAYERLQARVQPPRADEREATASSTARPRATRDRTAARIRSEACATSSSGARDRAAASATDWCRRSLVPPHARSAPASAARSCAASSAAWLGGGGGSRRRG